MKNGLFLLLALGCGSADDGALDTTSAEHDQPASPDAVSTTTGHGALPPEWACLGQAPSMAEREPGRVQYVVPVVDFDQVQPIAPPDLQVKVCADPACSAELPPCDDDVGQCYQLVPDSTRQYVLAFDFPFGFDGALRFSAPGYVDLDYVLGGPMVGTPDGEMTVNGNPVFMVPTTAMDGFYRELDPPTVDPTRGMLMMTVLDCLGARAQDVAIRPVAGNIDEASVAYRLSPANILTPDSLRTDSRGVAGFINLSPDAFTVGANAPSGEEYARSTVIVRANSITMAELRAGLGMWGQ